MTDTPPPTPSPAATYLAPIVAAVLASLLTAALVLAISQNDTTDPENATPPPTIDDPPPAAQEPPQTDAPTDEEFAELLASIPQRDENDPRALGPADAPIVIVQWADFLCPFCGQFARDTEPDIIANYVEEGLVRIEWRDLPFQGDEAFLAALGGLAAAGQGAFWEYHHAIYELDPTAGDGQITAETLTTLAGELGLDPDQFAAALDDPDAQQQIQEDIQFAQEIGIEATPTFLVGDTPLAGAQPFDVFAEVIEDQLQRN